MRNDKNFAILFADYYVQDIRIARRVKMPGEIEEMEAQEEQGPKLENVKKDLLVQQ